MTLIGACSIKRQLEDNIAGALFDPLKDRTVLIWLITLRDYSDLKVRY